MPKLSSSFGYKKLIIYLKAKSLVLSIYKTTANYPKTEIYTLVPQMRRAAISVLANIVEGYSKETSPEYARFLTISIGSITELEVYLDISFEPSFVDREQLLILENLINETKKLLYGTRKAVRSR